MHYKELHKEFHRYVHPSQPNEWDIEDALTDLEELSEDQQDLLLQAIPTVWPISHSLSFSFLKEGAKNAGELDRNMLAEWLRRILQSYEEGGLKKARAYMTHTDPGRLDEDIDTAAVALHDHYGRLSSFARAMSGLSLSLQLSDATYTDTETIYLPEQITLFAGSGRNLLCYRLFIALQASFIRLGSLNHRRLWGGDVTGVMGETVNQGSRAEAFFHTFEKSGRAHILYEMMELYRAFALLRREYGGLIRKTRDIRRKLCVLRRRQNSDDDGSLAELLESIVVFEDSRQKNHSLLEMLQECREPFSAGDMLSRLDARAQDLGIPGEEKFCFTPLMDHFNFAESEKITDRRITENKKKFATSLADFIRKKHLLADEEQTAAGAGENQADSAKIMVSPTDDNYDEVAPRANISINNSAIELPDDICSLINSIEADLGRLPESYVSAAFGLAGRGKTAGEGADNSDSGSSEKFVPYDEWDYRRHGYRKNWCALRQRTLKGVRADFVDRTLDKHRGILMKIRRQFEMMRTQERFARRRRHGDDLDLDAVIDSLGDQRAGLPPSEKLFVRLLRDERSISTLFLVDMSNSTEGWVGTAIKEALVLLCEAMESVGDCYGIYGFSGMRRMRSEVYGIKDITERYNSEVKARIAAISPKEYTRMGPPIRHMIHHFNMIESKSRLLLILSDGKPEDYDAYKGRYAIEDTRKALAEARGRGIHPYCITIDQESHDYLEHLFGRGNYTYVKNIDQLPSRLTEIYRLLTR